MTHYRNIDIDGLKIFYREAGRRDGTLLLCTAFLRRRSCFASCSIDWPIASTWWRRTIPASATAMRRCPTSTPTRSMRWPARWRVSPSASS